MFGSHTEKRIINLTPHDIAVVVDGKKTIFERSGNVARVVMSESPQHPIKTIEGPIPVVYSETGELSGLPEPERNVVYLVSLVALRETNRKDVFAPDTGKTAIRNESGQIMAVTRFISAVKTFGRCKGCGLEDDISSNDGFCYPCGSGQGE